MIRPTSFDVASFVGTDWKSPEDVESGEWRSAHMRRMAQINRPKEVHRSVHARRTTGTPCSVTR